MKKIIFFIIAFMFFCNTYVYAEEFDITGKNVILYNMNDNSILYDKKSDEQVEIASLTKIMTTIVAIENINDLDEEVVVKSSDFKGIDDYAQAGLKIGDKVSYRDLLYGIMLPSGADCVNVVINNLGGQDKFIDLMNKKVSELKLKNTKFDNAIGMDSDDNYSTAGDLAKILEYALKNDIFKEIFTTKKYTIKNINLKLNSTLVTYGKYLDVSNINGAKSGYTDGAGVCLASIATLNDVDYLLVMLGSSTTSKSNAIRDSLEIYNYYEKNYAYRNVLTKGQLIKTVNVKWGKVKTYKLKSDKDIELYLKNSVLDKDIEYDYVGIEELNYKIHKGDKLGRLDIKYDGNVLVTYDVYLQEGLEYYHPVIYSIIGVSIVMLIISLVLINKKKKRKKRRRKKRK